MNASDKMLWRYSDYRTEINTTIEDKSKMRQANEDRKITLGEEGREKEKQQEVIYV